MNKLLIALLFTGLAVACTTVMEPTADIPTVSYKNDIAPIIASNCAQSGCHGAERTEQFNLLSYAELAKLTVPDKPRQSSLYEVIRLYSGEKAMPPKPAEPLSDAQIGQIYIWILQGATNN